MTVENATYIAGLDPLRPLLDADISEGDDHLRLTKHVLVETFPGAAGNGFAKAITASEDELNRVEGVTSSIQDQLQALDDDKLGNVGNQVIDGQLQIENSLIVQGELGHGFGGMNIKRAAKALAWGALFNLDDNSGNVNIIQVGEGTLGGPDTKLGMAGGQVYVNARTTQDDIDNGVNPTDPEFLNSFTTKGWVEANFLGVTGGDLNVNGSITALRKIHVIDDGTSEGQGYGIWGSETEVDPKAGFYMDGTSDNVLIVQTGAGSDGNPATMLTLSDGRATLSAPYGGFISPVNGGDVVTRGWSEGRYVRANGLAALEAKVSAGVSGTFEDNNGKTITVTDGIITDLG